MFGGRKPTKKSCLVNAVVALALGVVMVLCMFGSEGITQERTRDFLIGAGIMAAVALYWVYRYFKFEDKNFNDPFQMNGWNENGGAEYGCSGQKKSEEP